MATLLYGSIDFSKLIDESTKGNPAFSRAKNGKIYLNLKVWINDQEDDYGNSASIQSSFKDAKKEELFYFGNLKTSGPTPLVAGSVDIPKDDDLPY